MARAYFDPPKSLPRLGSAVLVTHGERLLLGLRGKTPNKGRWVLPGGGVKPFESLADTARREILEETGLQIDVGNQIGTFEIIDEPREHRVIVYSWARAVGGEMHASSDLDALRFVSKDELHELDLTPIVQEVLRVVGWLSVPAPQVEPPAAASA